MMHIAAQPLLTPDGRVLLQLPELNFCAGECWMVLGPNGAGKSTFLRHAAGQSAQPNDPQHSAEHWRWQNQALPAWHDLTWAQQRAYLPQQHSLRAPLSVAAIVRMGAFPWQGVHANLASTMASVLQVWELEHLLDRPWTALSGGEQQRVQLARTALQIQLAKRDQARLWLLDEPLAALDWRHQAVALQAMRAEAEAGALVLASVHDMNAALAIASHVLVFAEGEVLLQGVLEAEPLREALSQAFGLRLAWAAISSVNGHSASRQWLVPLP